MNAFFKKSTILLSSLILAACGSTARFKPIQTISQVDTQSGYRLMNNISHKKDDALIVLALSGGGTRAAALGYGVLEEFNKVTLHNGKTLLDSIDLVFGVSGGSILAAYFSLYGTDTIPRFEQSFLNQDFQHNLIMQAVSIANMPKLATAEYGFGDLLQEELENYLFGHRTFADLTHHRKGPFAVISATDMGSGQRFDFTQETFDAMCLNLESLRIARAVASSSAVPVVFSPLTLNNNGGNCNYHIPEYKRPTSSNLSPQQRKTASELATELKQYENSKKRPFIHLLDGGLTDNLGLRNILEIASLSKSKTTILPERIRHIVVINVNAQSKLQSPIDQSADVPSLSDVINTVINVPIDQNSIASIRQFRSFVDEWNNHQSRLSPNKRIQFYFINLNLYDLPNGPFRAETLVIPTTLHLPKKDIQNLKKAAQILLQQSPDYQNVLKEFQQKTISPGATPSTIPGTVPSAIFPGATPSTTPGAVPNPIQPTPITPKKTDTFSPIGT